MPTENINIGCVVVLFNPDETVVEHIKQYPDEFDEIILVDNSDKDNEFLFTEVLNERIKYVPLYKNTGIAYAMNCAIRILAQRNQYVITMDQDSIIRDNIVKVYLEYIHNHKGLYVLTPKFNTDRNPVVESEGTERVELSMQSGTLFPIEIFNKIGYFSEDMFLDMTDWEFFNRMKKYNIPLIRCNEAVLDHQPAITKEKVILGHTLKYGVASPVRYYYHFRNLLWNARTYHSITMYKEFIIKLLKVLLLFDNKKDYLAAYKQGIKDANNGKLGAYSGNK